MKVPFLDLETQYKGLKSEMDAAIHRVIDTTQFIGGAALQAFEKDFAAAHHAKHAIGVANGTDAIVVALRCLGIGPGDTVATAANSFIASSEAITLAGARPLFVDCGDDYTLDPKALETAMAKQKVRAIIPVHLYGRACDMTAITAVARAHDAAIVEDCAQAHLAEHAGKKVGSFGAAASFSFYPGKNLGAYGDAGALISNDDALAERMRMYANHGRKEKYDHVFEGTNSRLDNLQAAVLGVKLPHLETWTRARIRVADGYRARLAGTTGLELPAAADGLGHVYHLFVVRVSEREKVRARLKELGVDTGVHYPSTLPNLEAYRALGHSAKDSPNATRFESQILSLPIYPELTDAQLDHVADALRTALR